jgi:CRP-like cAMP-binding protein
MPVSEAPPALGENRLLAALPKKDYERLRPRLEPVSLAAKQVVYEADRPIPHVYFPRNCVISMVLHVEGGAVEVGTVGHEGMAGLPVFLGTDSFPSLALCQVPGEAVRVRAKALKEAVRESESLHDLLHRYAHYMLVQSAQSAACNRLHSAEERLCRWLLMMHDRVGADRFPLTQEFMAQMLGVRRPTVSLIASTLQKAGLIQYSRGKMLILDRPGLESAACECYAVTRKELERLLGR